MTAIRLPIRFDTGRLLAEVEALAPSAFEEIGSSHITPGGLYAAHLLIVDPSLARQEARFPFQPSPALLGSPYLSEVLSTFQSPKTLARVHRLHPGATIHRHTDGNYDYHRGFLRLHIPVSSTGTARFELDGQDLEMLPGECWALNVAKTHEVHNDGPKARIHIVADCARNSWWDALFAGMGEVFWNTGPYDQLKNEDLQTMLETMPAGAAGEELKVAIKAELLQRHNRLGQIFEE